MTTASIAQRAAAAPNATARLASAARNEGWGFYDVDRSGYLELLRDPTSRRFDSDLDVWRFMSQPSALHAEALAHLCASNPAEWMRVVTIDEVQEHDLTAAASGLHFIQTTAGWEAQAIPGASRSHVDAARALGIEGLRRQDRASLAARVDAVLRYRIQRECGLCSAEWHALGRATRCRLALGFILETQWADAGIVTCL